MHVYVIILSGALLIVLFTIFTISVIKRPPVKSKINIKDLNPLSIGDNLYKIDKNWLHRNEYGLYELFIEGEAFHRGLIIGRLTENLIHRQEKIFIEEIKKIIPNSFYLGILKIIVAWMNRNLNKFIGEEYCKEIYGVSLSASDKFNTVGPKYIRIMNYHAAHDIGHTLQYMNFVGCTAFSLKNEKTYDGKLLHARNFDFHIGDEFSRDKIVAFYAPEKGLKFVMITWGSLIGTVSGMNIQGIVVTVNAAKSRLPLKTATPVTILVREILQYSSTIEEAIEIARKRNISVSEIFLVSDGKSNRSVVIEKTPYHTEVIDYETNQTICTNHFQSEKFINDEQNIKQMRESSSVYRYQRVTELINAKNKFNVEDVVEILRNRKGLHNTTIGDGNEMAINQLIAHHSVVFKPDVLKFWISTGPNAVGDYVCYDLHEVFEKKYECAGNFKIHSEKDSIGKDPFIVSGGYNNYLKFKELLLQIKSTKKPPVSFAETLIALNPESYLAYQRAGEIMKKNKLYKEATHYYAKALEKSIPTLKEKNEIEHNLSKCLKKCRK